jgi:hypothetical protein
MNGTQLNLGRLVLGTFLASASALAWSGTMGHLRIWASLIKAR